MIRSNLPLPFLYRLRLQAGSAARRTKSTLVHYRRPTESAAQGKPRNTRQTAARRTLQTSDVGPLWCEFVDQYERFTCVLCAAAQYGCDHKKEEEYAKTRSWFVANYYRIAPHVRPSLDIEFATEQMPPAIADYAGQKRVLDSLEALFLPPSLGDVLRHDTGNLIPHVGRISAVVYRCHEVWQTEFSTRKI